MNRLLEVVLFLNLTGLFSFVAIGLGLPIALVSAILMGVLILYLAVNYRRATWLLQQPLVLAWVVFVFVWPALTLPFAPVFDLRSALVNLYLVLLMLASAVWVTRVGIRRAGNLVIVSSAVVLFGLALSLIAGDFFNAVAEAANAHASYKNRAFGFFLQPNVAAENLCFLFAFFFLVASMRSTSTLMIGTILFIAAVMLTGSRGGMIIAFAMVGYATLLAGRGPGAIRGGDISKRFAALVAVVAAVLVVNQLVAILSASGAAPADGGYTLADRVRAVLTLDLKGGGLVETLLSRYVAIQEHWPGIVANPVLGNGIAASQNLAAAGVFTYASHNQYLQVAFDLGIPAVAVFLVILASLWRRALSPIESSFARGALSGRLLVIAVLLAGLFSNSILNSRVFFVVLGIWIGLSFAPLQVFRRRLRFVEADIEPAAAARA